MSIGKYHTIDPLILETLNLNEKRMNQILDILHGRPAREYSAFTRKATNRTYLKDQSQPTISQEEEQLPPILLNRRKVKKEPISERTQPKTYRKLHLDKSKDSLIPSKSRSLQKINDSQEHSHQQKQFSYKKRQIKKSPEKRIETLQTVNWGEEATKLHEEKKKQLMNDYMMGKLKRSKSQEINPKDVYRLEIEQLVAQLTPIEELEEVQRKMQRLKRRVKHLQTFDKNYYLRLNQHDMVVLS